jgi:hypothetical protein
MSVILDYSTLRMALMDRRDVYIGYSEKCSDPDVFRITVDKIQEIENVIKTLEGSEEVMILSRTL